MRRVGERRVSSCRRKPRGGDGETGWDWVIKAFELASEYFPNAELILNEYSVMQDAATTASFVALVDLLQERGLIDGIGKQGHVYERWPALDVLSANLDTLAATGLPLCISELDVSNPNDSCQAARLSELFAVLWDHASIVGTTRWGYLKGSREAAAFRRCKLRRSLHR